MGACCSCGQWDKLAPQVINTLNMMQALRIDWAKLVYETLYNLYNWNRYPLALMGCKALVYKDSDTRGLWALQGVDGLHLGPSMDHHW